jgi:hypothetical protein
VNASIILSLSVAVAFAGPATFAASGVRSMPLLAAAFNEIFSENQHIVKNFTRQVKAVLELRNKLLRGDARG